MWLPRGGDWRGQPTRKGTTMAETNATLTEKHAAYLGLDVGKFFHWAYAVDREGTVLLSRRVANSEAELDAAIAELPADTLVVVDQRRNIGALAIRRARAAGRSPAAPGWVRLRLREALRRGLPRRARKPARARPAAGPPPDRAAAPREWRWPPARQ